MWNLIGPITVTMETARFPESIIHIHDTVVFLLHQIILIFSFLWKKDLISYQTINISKTLYSRYPHFNSCYWFFFYSFITIIIIILAKKQNKNVSYLMDGDIAPLLLFAFGFTSVKKEDRYKSISLYKTSN